MKNPDRSRKALSSFGLIALLAVGAATAQVATGTTGIDASGSYRSEMQACMSGQTQQDRDTCMKEARNAAAEKRRGNLDTYSTHEANRIARCEVLQGENRAACHARMMGYGSSDGSVAGGGVLREVETVVLPAGHSNVIIEAQTSDPVLLVPNK